MASGCPGERGEPGLVRPGRGGAHGRSSRRVMRVRSRIRPCFCPAAGMVPTRANPAFSCRRLDERRQESGAEAPSPGGGGEVDGVLDRAGVSLVGVPRARDGEADHALAAVPAVPLAALIPLDGDERGPARDLRFQPGDGLVGVLLPLRPDRQGVADGGVADPPDGGGVRGRCRADVAVLSSHAWNCMTADDGRCAGETTATVWNPAFRACGRVCTRRSDRVRSSPYGCVS